MDIVIPDGLPDSSLHFVGIKHQDQDTFPVSLIIAQNIHQLVPGPVNRSLGQLPQLLPGKHDVVTVHQKILLLRRFQFPTPDPTDLLISHLPWPLVPVLLPLADPVSAGKYLLQLLVIHVETPGAGPAPGLRLLVFSTVVTYLKLHRALHMHVLLYLIPRNLKPGSMGAEHGTCGVVHIPLRVIPRSRHYLILIAAGLIPGQAAGKLSPPSGVGRHLHLVIPHQSHRGIAADDGPVPLHNRRLKPPLHPVNISQRPPCILRGDLQPESKERLQKPAVSLHKPLAHRPVSGLAKISALGVFQMSPPRNQGDLHIRQLRPCQHSGMPFFLQVSQDQPLPAAVQHILAASGIKDQSAASLPRFHEKMHLRIVAQRLKMSHSFYSPGDGLLVHNISRSKLHIHPKSLADHAFQDLNLHLTHDLDLNLPVSLVPGNM